MIVRSVCAYEPVSNDSLSIQDGVTSRFVPCKLAVLTVIREAFVLAEGEPLYR